MDSRTKVGALWLKTSKKGAKFLTGEVELSKCNLTGDRVKLVVFPNNFKKSDKHPDYIMYEAEDREQGTQVKQNDPIDALLSGPAPTTPPAKSEAPSTSSDDTGDGLPF